MPIVNIQLLEGRSDAQKEALIEKVTAAGGALMTHPSLLFP
ncbi:tautomerase family protein [Halomonas nitroreducens]|uniref:4-oxalocrotonate tautomerase-like domain-containing protein n=1 Tax=Halomonas nitroreducens TaxID=447425 RepID=A0A3S0HRX4_9GAMM|nr:tautomerase family protein [Halomonas nitroreducens]RTR06107.1 hypothetical protein EKG36_05025 [Halomonas nitroreducens]